MNNDTIIGMDLGNAKHVVCALGADAKVLFRCEVANGAEALAAFFKEHAGATVAMETGTCCRFVSALARSCGCAPLVGNARKLALIWKSRRKNDECDAEKLARLARADRELFSPVELRDDEHHEMVQLIGLRDVAVAQRTQAVNAVRGMCKAFGVFLPKCGAECFHKAAGSCIPKAMMWKFAPMLGHLRELKETIRRYDKLIGKYSKAHFGEEAALLQTAPGVGEITSNAYVAAFSDPKKFGKARDAGAFVGLIPAQDKSGTLDVPRRITKTGCALLRTLLVNAANYVLRASSPDNALKRYGQRIAARGGKVAKRKAKVAVARKLAVILLAMLKSGKPYDDSLAATF